MSHLGGIGSPGDARRAHLALITGGAHAPATKPATTQRTTAGSPLEAARTAATDRTPPRSNVTAFGPAAGARALEAVRSQHEQRVRAVARQHATFEEAIGPMIRVSGVSSRAADAVANAILNTPTLRNQAERAYARARADRG